MKTLKEPQEPFCPPFLLPLSPLSRRRHVAFCAFNQQLFLSSRDLSVFCPDSLSLFLENNKKESQRPIFSDQKAQKSASFLPLHQKDGKISRVFHFCEHCDSWHQDRKDTQKTAIFKSKLNELHHNNPARADEL